ncbi:WhiB family transcriptional regulator [Streptomyces sp. NBC_00160]|uniref:WhiB family transcriptional regulator n=1 Tax=Streptomyces sp. NBC_00160 TaxID=2903628 RepID=UPI0022537129|nr:WhiB family transcriptional regulator [Streptomyces sp. NBC_00160]MCX5303107.1 WhiB family transcriptional regulator [Streptomyces sp. NBC_00160]
MHYITTHETPAVGLRGVGDHSWYERALCYGMDIEEADKTFFPEASATEDIERARIICGHCPVRQECFDAAMDTGSRTGIRAGLTESERMPYHKKVAERLDYRRVEAVFRGRDVALSTTERNHVVRKALHLGWSIERLSKLLRTEYDYTRRLMNKQRKAIAAEQEKAAKDRAAALSNAEVVNSPKAQAPSLVVDFRTAA